MYKKAVFANKLTDNKAAGTFNNDPTSNKILLVHEVPAEISDNSDEDSSMSVCSADVSNTSGSYKN